MGHRLKFRKARVVAIKKQTAKNRVSRKKDAERKALKPGIRVSKTGSIYTETRANRSDINPTKKL